MAYRINHRQWKFAVEYCKDRDAGAALKRAGYKVAGKATYALASRLLRKPEIAKEIEERSGKLADQALVDVPKVLREFAIIAFADMGDYLQYDEGGFRQLVASDRLPKGATRAIAEFIQKDTAHGREVRIRLHSKTEALYRLGEYLGMFKKRVELVDRDGGNPLTTALMEVWKRVNGGGSGGGERVPSRLDSRDRQIASATSERCGATDAEIIPTTEVVK